MFCKKCGKEINDSAEFCKFCGTSAKENNNSTTKKKLSKKTLITSVVILTLAVVTVLGATVGRPILRSIFGPKDTLTGMSYKEVELLNLKNGLDILSAQSKRALNIPETGSGLVKLELSDTAKELLKQNMPEDYIGDVNSASLEFDYSCIDNILGLDLDLKVKDTDILGLEYILDFNSNNLYLTLPDLMNEYYKSYFSDVTMPSFEAFSKLAVTDELSEEVINIFAAALSEIDEVETCITTIEVDGVNQECSEYKIEFNNEMLTKVLTALLNSAKNSDTLEAEIQSFVDALEELYGVELGNVTYEMDNAIESIVEDMDFDEIKFTYTIYADKNNDIIGRTILADDGGFSMLTAMSDSDFASELAVTSYGDKLFVISEKGTHEDDKFTGTAQISVNDYAVLNMSFHDLYVNYKEYEMSGEFTLSCANGISEVFDYLNQDVLTVLKALDLGFSVDCDDNSSVIVINVKTSGLNFATLTVESALNSQYKAAVPSNITESEDVFNNIDLNKVFDKLESVGVPFDVIEPMRSSLNLTGQETEYEIYS